MRFVSGIHLEPAFDIINEHIIKKIFDSFYVEGKSPFRLLLDVCSQIRGLKTILKLRRQLL